MDRLLLFIARGIILLHDENMSIMNMLNGADKEVTIAQYKGRIHSMIESTFDSENPNKAAEQDDD